MASSTIDLIEKLEINEINNRFRVQATVSGGMGARSFKGVDKESGQPVFMKYLLFPSSTYEIAKFQSEIEVTKLITSWAVASPGCICAEYIHSEVLFDGNAYCLITKWHSLPTLDEWLKENPNLSIEERLEIIHRVINAVSHIPSGIHHRDLHPKNILVENMTVDWHQRASDVGIRIIDWGEAIPESHYGFEDTPEYVELLINNAPKKIEGSYYSLPPEVFTPWEGRKHQYGKYDVWAIALLMHKVLTNKDVIEHEDLGSYINSLTTGGMGNALRIANRNILDLDHRASLLLSKVFQKMTLIEPNSRQPLAYAGRVIWDIRIEEFIPKDIHESHLYLTNPFDFTPKDGWKHSGFDEFD